MEGTVKWFNKTKGYGFVQGEDGGEYFVHHTALAPKTFLRENDKVSFNAVETDKGKQAQNVTLLQKGSEMAGGKQKSFKEEGSEESEESSEEESSEENAEEDSEEF